MHSYLLARLLLAGSLLAWTSFASGAAGPVTDEFNATTLNTSLWTTVNPVGDGTVSVNGSEALLSVPAASSHDAWTGGNNTLRILQPVTSGDFYVELKFDSAVTTGNQDQGLLVVQDATHYVRFDVYYGNSTVNYFSASFNNNSPTVYANAPLGAIGSPVWLRVQRLGNNWTGTWSSDGTNYNAGASFSLALTAAQMGPFAGNVGSPAPAFTSKVDYIRNLATSSTPAPDLKITKTHSGNFTQGGTGSYTLTISNVGSASTSGTITVTDPLPAGLTPTSATGAGWSCSISTQTVTCTSTTALTAGSTAPTITLNTSVAVNAGANITNTASVAGNGDSSTTNNSASDPTTIAPSSAPDLTITKSHTGSFLAGGTGTYSLTVKNSGSVASSGTITITDPVPTGMTPTSASGTGWTCSVSGQTLTCTSATSLAAGVSASPISLSVNVATNAPSTLTNTVSVSGGGEANTSNDSASDATTITTGGGSSGPVSDDFNASSLNTSLWTVTNPVGDGAVSLNGTEALLSLPAGSAHDAWTGGNATLRILQPISNADFSVELKFDSPVNTGNQDQGLLVVQDSTHYVRFDIYYGNGTANYFSASFNGNTPTVYANNALGALGSPTWLRVQRTGSSWVGTWSSDGVNFNAGVSFSLALTAAQIGPYAGNTNSPVPAFTSKVDYFHNLATTTTNKPDLTLTKTHTGTFTQGGAAVYTLAVSNVGTVNSLGTITVSDTVPSGLTPTSASGTGWSCSISGQAVSCSSTSVVTTGMSATPVTLKVSIANNASSSITNTASVSGGGESNTSNNSASDPVTVTTAGSADLTIAKSHTGTFTQGGTGSYTLIATNSGTSATTSTITVSDVVPTGLTPTSAAGTGWNCSISGQTATCTQTTALAAGTSASPITLNVSIATNAPSSITNTASISGGGETNTSNDSATDPTVVGGASGSSGPVSDDFNASALNTSLWTVVNPAGDGVVTLNGSDALLTLPAGNVHDAWTGGNGTLRILQPMTNSDFSVELKFDSPVNTASQDEGLLVQQDVNNYIRFDFYYGNSTVNFFSASFANDSPTVYANGAIGAIGAPIWLRVQRQGNNWTAKWSSDGVNFNSGTSFSLALTTSQIGPFAGNNGSPAPGFSAKLDYFHNLNSTGTSAPDLTIVKSHTGTFAQGGTGAYRLVASNAGTAATSGMITVTDTLPSGLVPTAATGSGWTCSISGQTVTCKLTSVLSAGTSAAAITLNVSIAANAAASVTNTATVSGGGETATGNDSASDPTTISSAAAADLVLTKTHTGTFTAGGTGSYSLTAKNAGSVTTSGSFTVTDSVPSGLTPTSATGTGWTCSISGQSVSCNSSAALAANASAAAITLNVNVASNAPATITNTATVSGGGESNTTNNSASDPTTIATAGGGVGFVSDDFHSSTLNTSRWTFVNPKGDGTVSLDGTHANISVPAGTDHDVWTDGNNSARILQNVANGDFDIQVKYDSVVDQACQDQGLLIQQDATNFVRMDVYSSGTYANLFAATFTNGSPTVQLNSRIGSSITAPFFLRTRRTGDTFSFQTSTDGVNFTEVANFVYHLAISQVGLYAGNSKCGYVPPAFTSSVDYVFNTSSPVTPEDGVVGSKPVINVWYGNNQTFGQNGIPQTWVNILGTALSPNGSLASLSYTLNGGAAKSLQIGADNSRLVQPGDFNADIPYTSLNSGANTLVITATDASGQQTSQSVTVNYVTGQSWPTTYSVNWSSVSNIQSAVQIVDGKWQLQSDGTVRTMEVGYDRLLSLGDMSTWSNYVVTAETTIHFINDPNIPPSMMGNDSDFGVGILVGWHGHTYDEFGTPVPTQPGFGHPFPGVGWYTSVGGNGTVLELYQNTASHPESTMAFQPSSGLALQFETKYILKMQVQKNASGTSSHYSFKAWPASSAEPSTWNVQADGDVSQGSVVLAAHRSDVSFGAITVKPLP